MRSPLEKEQQHRSQNALVPTVSAEEVRQALANVSTPVVVLISAQWCGPCKVMHGRLERLVQQLPGKLQVLCIDTELSEGGAALASELRVSQLPTILVCGPSAEGRCLRLTGLTKDAALLDLVTNRAPYLGSDLSHWSQW